MAIPTDDIMEIYGRLPADRKEMVTGMAASDTYICTGFSESLKKNRGSGTLLYWSANPPTSTFFLSIAFEMGRKEFGDIWARDLVEHFQKQLQDQE